MSSLAFLQYIEYLNSSKINYASKVSMINSLLAQFTIVSTMVCSNNFNYLMVVHSKKCIRISIALLLHK